MIYKRERTGGGGLSFCPRCSAGIWSSASCSFAQQRSKWGSALAMFSSCPTDMPSLEHSMLTHALYILMAHMLPQTNALSQHRCDGAYLYDEARPMR